MFKEILNNILEYIKSNVGKTMGALLGFLIALLVLTIGFFKTFFISLCTLLGYFLGKKMDKGENIKDYFLNKIIAIRKRF